jgi:hypothetical protein
MLVEDTMLVKFTYPNALSLPWGPAELGLGLASSFRYEIWHFHEAAKMDDCLSFLQFLGPDGKSHCVLTHSIVAILCVYLYVCLP